MPIDLSDILADIPTPIVEVPAFDSQPATVPFASPKGTDIFAEQKRKAWHEENKIEARCDFTRKVRLTRRGGVFFMSLWQKSVFGRTLTDIKSDDTMVDKFATEIVGLIHEIIGHQLCDGSWCVVTTPKRRHLVKNFSTRVSEQMGNLLNIPFYEDVAICRSKQRINAVYDLNILPKEPNIICFDDFVTTGSTLGAMDRLLKPLGKNVIYFTGINNIL